MDKNWILLIVVCLCNCGRSQPVAVVPQSADYVVAEAGPVAQVVRQAAVVGKQAQRELVVYIGATWCEPCEHFLVALQKRSLPAQLNHVRFLKFDFDADEQRLDAAGYGGKLIPRFVIPNADGTASNRRFEGSVKGAGAVVENLVPNLEALLAQ